MKITIERSEGTTGFFSQKKYYSCYARIELTLDEDAIIRKADLYGYTVFIYPEWGPRKESGDRLRLEAGTSISVGLMLDEKYKFSGGSFLTKQEADRWERELTTQILPDFKRLIQSYADYDERRPSKTFEL